MKGLFKSVSLHKKVNDQLLTYTFLFFAGLGLSFIGVIDISEFSNYFDKKKFSYQPEYDKTRTHEINMIYIGSSRCSFSNSEDLHRAVDSLKILLQRKSHNYKLGFSAIGIAAEWNPKAGISHIKKFGLFDEIISGNSWSNTGILKYVGTMGQEASTPQIIITLRKYTETLQSNISEEKSVIGLRGRNKILEWYHNGAPLPEKFKTEIRKL